MYQTHWNARANSRGWANLAEALWAKLSLLKSKWLKGTHLLILGQVFTWILKLLFTTMIPQLDCNVKYWKILDFLDPWNPQTKSILKMREIDFWHRIRKYSEYRSPKRYRLCFCNTVLSIYFHKTKNKATKNLENPNQFHGAQQHTLPHFRLEKQTHK